MNARRLFIDQCGARYYAATRRQLIEKVGGGRCSIMYCDKIGGGAVRIGYVIGRLWLTEYAPVERAA